MKPFEQYYSRYQAIRKECQEQLDENNFLAFIDKDAGKLNNLMMAGLGMGTLFLRMGAVIQMSAKLHDGDTSNDALYMKQVIDNLRETLPSDTNWKNLWYASIHPGSKWETAIPKNSKENNNTILDRFVTFRNKFVHQSIRITSTQNSELKKGIDVLDSMANLYSLFESGSIELKEEKYFWIQETIELELYPFVQSGQHEGLPYLFQGLYENKSKAKFINTLRGDETNPEINPSLNEQFLPMQDALRGGAGQVFDHSERVNYYLECFVGREREVKSVLNWVNSDSEKNVLPIYSEAGMGKGALIAGIIKELQVSQTPTMYHFCGSGMANSLHAILYHFILQGKKMPGMNGAGVWKVIDELVQRKMDRLPSRYFDAIRLFQTLLSDCFEATAKYKDKPIIIIIDGLDEAAVANSQLKISDWFYTYNDKDEIEDNWKSPAYVKWIFSYRSLPDKNKEGFKLNGQFALEQNELVQPLQGLTEDSVREALKKFEVSEEFVQTVIERGAVA